MSKPEEQEFELDLDKPIGKKTSLALPSTQKLIEIEVVMPEEEFKKMEKQGLAKLR